MMRPVRSLSAARRAVVVTHRAAASLPTPPLGQQAGPLSLPHHQEVIITAGVVPPSGGYFDPSLPPVLLPLSALCNDNSGYYSGVR